MGSPLLAGREFTARDGPGAPRVVIVNRSFSRRYFGQDSGVGRRLGTTGAGSSRDLEIVGVVADAKTRDLRKEPAPAIFLPLGQQEGFRSLTAHVRNTGRGAGHLEAVDRAVRLIGSGLEMTRVTSVGEVVSDSLRRDSMFAGLTTIFGAMALLLTGVGLYGTMAYAASQRTHEIGIRQALGASRESIVRLMLRDSAIVVGLGVAIGLPVAAADEQALRSALFGLGPADPVAFFGAVALLAGVGILASLVPALRATARHPMHALRHE